MTFRCVVIVICFVFCIEAKARIDHPVRAPFVLDSTAVAPGQYAIASAGETSIVVFREEAAPGRILGRRSDGRGLVGTWANDVVSDESAAERELHRDSIQVAGNQAVAVWLEDENGANHTRLFCNRFNGVAWGGAHVVNDTGIPASHDLLDFACAMRAGPNGSPYVAITFVTRDVNTHVIALFAAISANGGQTFQSPVALSSFGPTPGGAAQAVGGLAVDLKGAEFHAAWSDDRHDPGNRREVFYRRGLLDWSGNLLFIAPLGTGADRQISFIDNVIGDPVIAVDDDPFDTTGFGKHVGIAWLEENKGAALPTLLVRPSHDSGTNFLLESPVAHTAFGGVAAHDCDLEILGGRFVATWEDNARDAGGGVIVMPPGFTQVWRAVALDGTDFSAGGTGVVRMLSAQTNPSAQGSDPVIARATGLVDAAVIAFIESDAAGPEVRTAFADQAYGSQWHIDDLPVVSKVQTGIPVKDVTPPRAAYNARYSNFLVCWQEEIVGESEVRILMLAGYRPQTIEIEGWSTTSPALWFRMEHLPFTDSFAFVLISSFASADPALSFALPDGRRTGLLPDVFQQFGLQNFVFFLAQNDPVNEGAATLQIPLPPGLIVPGMPLACTGVTFGANGALHVLTDYDFEGAQ